MLKSDHDTTIFYTLRMRIKSHTRVHITHTYLTAITRPSTSVPEISRVHQVTVITAGRTAAVGAATYFIVLAVAWVITVRAEFARFCEGNSNYSSAISSRTPYIFWPWWRHQMETFSTLLAISGHKGQWRGALMFSSICARINGWVNQGEAGDLRRHRALNDVIVTAFCISFSDTYHV